MLRLLFHKGLVERTSQRKRRTTKKRKQIREKQKIRENGIGEKISKSYKDKERETPFIVYFYWRISNNCSIMQNIYILKDKSREVRNEDCVSGFDSGF